ncbi:urea ABC transporter ATP-binding protein UrtD [Allohahella sp. A8]|uniref:urea ABC transporter ATP-binding protein UrtD n=1 Tax=Allohahella sp. A8 TaxID=3141461 RepID=UPI000C090811|nr:urea ABC transporter ATP-binding protein UrtD [Hahellaceae bacterium]|tara:strand:+ start:38081 stop:38902 length:822 start_codon:yes stop_codon:yes gene_type:complete
MSLISSIRQRDRVFDFLAPQGAGNLDTRKGYILYMEDVSVSFDGFKAINNLNLYIREGELRCIIGPNGAGKTTMMDIITGKTKPDSGSVWFGQTMNLLNMKEPEIANAGIGRKFQKPTVFEALTVFENLWLALGGQRSIPKLFNRRLGAEQLARLDEVINLIGLSDLQLALAGTLSHGQKQWLEIGMLLMQNPKMLLVDEPVAGMTHQEMDKTAELLNRLAGRHTVVVVEHDMEFIRSIARTVTVLHQGSILKEGSMDQVQSDAKVREVYLGA